jgi:hypothetical protein
MAIQKILATDRIESGFRTKYNQTVDEIWVNILDLGNGSIRITKVDGTSINVSLTSSFYTKSQIQNLLTGNLPATETTAGIVELATLTETNEGNDDGRVITPFKAKFSTLFPLKGNWSSTFGEDPGDPLSGGYDTGMIVIYSGSFYLSLVDENKVEPGTDITKWEIVGATPNIEVNKTGADVDSNGDLDLSSLSLPDKPKNPTVYVNNITGSFQIQFNKSTKVISGLYGVAPDDVIEIIF